MPDAKTLLQTGTVPMPITDQYRRVVGVNGKGRIRGVRRPLTLQLKFQSKVEIPISYLPRRGNDTSNRRQVQEVAINAAGALFLRHNGKSVHTLFCHQDEQQPASIAWFKEPWVMLKVGTDAGTDAEVGKAKFIDVWKINDNVYLSIPLGTTLEFWCPPCLGPLVCVRLISNVRENRRGTIKQLVTWAAAEQHRPRRDPDFVFAIPVAIRVKKSIKLV